MVWHLVGSWKAEKASCFIGNFGEFGETTAFSDDVEQIAMLAGRRVRPFAGSTLARFGSSQPDEQGAPWRVADIANQPVAAFSSAVGEVVTAHRLGIARETVRQIGGLMAHGYAAARSAMRSSG